MKRQPAAPRVAPRLSRPPGPRLLSDELEEAAIALVDASRAAAAADGLQDTLSAHAAWARADALFKNVVGRVKEAREQRRGFKRRIADLEQERNDIESEIRRTADALDDARWIR